MTDKELIEMGMALAKSISSAKARQYYLDPDTLNSYLLEKFSSKMLPKLKAAIGKEKFKPKAYISKCYHGYILNFIRDFSKPIKVDRRYKDIYLLEKAYLKKRPEATDSQIAAECGTDVETLKEMRACMTTTFVSLDALMSEPITVQEAIPDFTEQEEDVYNQLINLPTSDFNKAYSYFVLNEDKYANEPINSSLSSLQNQISN